MTITGALHIHSAHSYDAKLSIKAIREIAERRGISFLCFTEHSDELTKEAAEAFVRECEAASDDTFICIPGFEVNYNGTHVLMIGCRTFVSQHATSTDLPLWKAGAALAIHAHPHRDRYYEDATVQSVVDGIEIWNAQYDGKRVPRNGAGRMFKKLSRKLPLHAFAGWDFHRASHEGGPLIAIHTENISEESILSALAAGNYTMSSALVSVGSDGKVLRGSPFMITLTSAFSTTFIALGKGVNAMLAGMGLRAPKPLAAAVRKRI